MQFVEQQRLSWNSNMWDTKGQNLDHKKWAKCKGSAGFLLLLLFFFCISPWMDFLRFLCQALGNLSKYGPNRWTFPQRVSKKEWRDRGGKGKPRPNLCLLTLKEQHANYIQSNMQMICKLHCEWASALFESTAQALLGEPSPAFSQGCPGSRSLARSIN